MRLVAEGVIGMREVNVPTKKLVTILKRNLKKHKASYEKAMKGYTKKLDKKVVQNLKLLTTYEVKLASKDVLNPPSPPSIRFDLTRPQSHEEDYQTAISMFELHVDETVKIRTDEYECYVLDKWEWKRSFDATNSMY